MKIFEKQSGNKLNRMREQKKIKTKSWFKRAIKMTNIQLDRPREKQVRLK